jgi:cell division protein FtsB
MTKLFIPIVLLVGCSRDAERALQSDLNACRIDATRVSGELSECKKDDALHAQIAALTAEKVKLETSVDPLRSDVQNLSNQKVALSAAVDELHRTEADLHASIEGRKRYVLRVSIRQVSYTINIRKQIADAVNEEEFDLVTDRQSYERTSVGSDLFDSFRIGSAIMKGHLGSWRLKVVSKNIITE